MKTERVALGDVFYVSTNFGIAKGHIVKVIESIIDGSSTIQYKLNIDDYYNEGTALNLKCGFFYCEDQLFKTPNDLLRHEARRWSIESVI